MCTVSVSEEAHSRVDVALKDMLNIFAGIVPLRNSKSFSPSGTVKIRMMVPFSEAVASKVPSLLVAQLDSGD